MGADTGLKVCQNTTKADLMHECLAMSFCKIEIEDRLYAASDRPEPVSNQLDFA